VKATLLKLTVGSQVGCPCADEGTHLLCRERSTRSNPQRLQFAAVGLQDAAEFYPPNDAKQR
jgi:hypothetical protein